MSIDGLTPASVSLAQLGEERREQAGAEIAKRFLIALLTARPLSQTAELPLAELAARGPALVRRLLLAIEDDHELRGLCGGSSRAGSELARLSAARDAEAIVAAAEALRGAAWSWLSRCAQEDGWALGAELANRLAYVCAELARGALAAVTERPDAESGPRQAAGRRAPQPEELAARRPYGGHPEGGVSQEPGAAVRLDPGWEFPDYAEGLSAEVAESRSWRRAPLGRAEGLADALPEGKLGGGPFAVLVIEPADAERLAGAMESGAYDALLERIGAVLAGELRPDDRIAQEGRGRWWLVAPHTDVPGARSLAFRLARAVAAAVSDHDRPLALAIGVAAGAENGASAAELAAHAEAELFSARAAGRPVAAQP